MLPGTLSVPMVRWVAGVHGFYWSSTQASSLYGYFLGFNSDYSIMNTKDKAYGFSLRCIKD